MDEVWPVHFLNHLIQTKLSKKQTFYQTNLNSSVNIDCDLLECRTKVFT